MDERTLCNILQNETHRVIVKQILWYLADQKVSVGDARNILDVAGFALNLSTVTGIDLPTTLTEERSGRLRYAPILTDTLLRES